MPNLSNQKIIEFYEKYNAKEIAFNKSIINIVGDSKQKMFF